MTKHNAQVLAHELTIEYLRVRTALISDVDEKIPDMVDRVADINRKFYDAIIHNKKFDGLYD